jgi:hypothetical protein
VPACLTSLDIERPSRSFDKLPCPIHTSHCAFRETSLPFHLSLASPQTHKRFCYRSQLVSNSRGITNGNSAASTKQDGSRNFAMAGDQDKVLSWLVNCKGLVAVRLEHQMQSSLICMLSPYIPRLERKVSKQSEPKHWSI